MNNHEILNGLEERESEIKIQIERLKGDLVTIARAKVLFEGETESQISRKTTGETPVEEKIKPTQAIREIFETYPGRMWYPGDLRDKLQTMNDANKLNTGYENLLYAVHSILREMEKQGEIEKSAPDKNRRRWYKKTIS